MACTPTPTETLFTIVTTDTLSTSFSSSVTTLPDSTTTVTSLSCLASLSGSCNASTLVTTFSTISGGVSTVQFPVTLTIPITATEATGTLFSTCSATEGTNSTSISSNSSGSSTSSTSSSPSISPSTNSTSSILILTTPTTTFVSQVPTTLANGTVVTEAITITSTLPPTPTYVPTVVPVTNSEPTSNHENSSINVGPIIGGVVGGFVGLFGIVGFIWLIWKRRRSRWDDIFEKEEDEGPTPTPVVKDRNRRLDLADAEPKPYHYGLVGRPSSTPQVSSSPPPSRPSSTVHDHGGPSSIEHAHGRAPSLAPLLFPTTPLTPGSSQPNTASVSRPSTAGSTNALIVHHQQPRRLSHGDEYSPDGNAPGPASSTVVTERERRNSRPSLRLANSDPNPPLLVRPNSPASPISIIAGPSRGPLHLANPPLSPTPTVASARGGASPPQLAPPMRPAKSPRRPSSAPREVLVHQDGGRVPVVAAQGSNVDPPAYTD